MPELRAHRLPAALALLLCLVLLPALPALLAQEGPEAPLTPEEAQAQIAALETATSLEEPVRAAALASWREALELLRQAEADASRTAGFEREILEAPGRLEAIRAELAQPPAEPKAEPPAGASAAQVEQLLAQAEAELQAARRNVDDLRQESARRVERRALLTDQITRLKQAVAAQTDALLAPSPSELGPELARARRGKLRAQTRQLQEELRAAQAELQSYDARQDLLPARRDRAQRRVGQAEKLVAAWQRAASEVRRREAERATEEAREARRQAARRSPVALELATENERLAERRSGEEGLGQKIDRAGEALIALRDRLQRLREDQRAVRRKVAAAGLTNAMGLLLRRQFESLPDLDLLERQSEQRLEQISDVQLQLIVLEEEREAWGDVDARTEEALRGVLPGPGRDELAEVVRELLQTRRDTLDALVADHTIYFNRLLELEAASRELSRAAEEYRAFIEERILWVRSVLGSPLPTPGGVAQAAAWLFSPQGWQTTARITLAEVRSRPLWCAAWCAAWGALLGASLWARRQLVRRAERVAARAIDSFPHTLLSLPLTVVVALPLPAAVWLLARLLGAPPEQHPLGVAAAGGLELAATFLLPLALVRAALRPRGLCEAHFRWPPASLARLRWALRWFVPLAVPAAAVVATLDQPENTLLADHLGRLAFAVETLALALLLVHTLGKGSPVYQALRRLRPGSLAVRAHWAWFWLALLAPLALLALAAAGYFYTAWQLEHRLRATLWLLLGLALVSALLHRWLYLTRYRLVLEKARAAAEAQVVAAVAAGAAPATSPDDSQDDTPAVEKVALAAVALAAAAEVEEAEAREESPRPAAQPEGSHSPAPVEEGRPGAEARTEAAAPVAPQPTPATTPPPPPPASQPPSSPPRPAEPSEDELDIPAVNAQVQTLFGSAIVVALVLGLWAIWFDVLPALRLLDHVQLWPRLELVAGKGDTPDALSGLASAEPTPAAAPTQAQNGGGASTPTLPGAPPLPDAGGPGGDGGDGLPTVVTLADAGLAVLLLVFTLVLGKNLPGLLEIILLQWLPLDGGARYALSTILRYAITMFGLSLVLGTIGIGWSKIQWLAAALTFGLAFGLQEIFANFVSGLIILFEQPIRVGDVVTIGAVSGRVTRVRIRATTVLDWDRKELIIPNKTIVTGDVINWTLTEPTLRVVIPVGLAYGADVERALRALEELARANLSVLQDPAPQAVFLGFGDNSLALELRVFVPHIDHLIPVKDALHRAIDARFRREKLEIAFPQRDVHLRSAEPLRVVVEREERGPR